MKRKSPKHRTTAGSNASDENTSAPNRKNRPSAEELVGTSEYQVQAATDLDEDEGDPLESVLEDRPEGGEDLFGPEMAVGQHHGGPPIEELVVEPDELGAHFLRGAVQEPVVEQEEAELDIRTEAEILSSGEERMLDELPGAAEAEGAAITRLPEKSELEAELSELTERAGKEVRPKRRADRIREQSRRVANQRKLTQRGHAR